MNFDLILNCAQEFAEENGFTLKIYDPFNERGAFHPEYKYTSEDLKAVLLQGLQWFQSLNRNDEREFYIEIIGPQFNYHDGPMEAFGWRPQLIQMRKALENRISVEITEPGTWNNYVGQMFDTMDEALVWIDQQTEKISGSQKWMAEISQPKLSEKGQIEEDRKVIMGPEIDDPGGVVEDRKELRSPRPENL